MEDPARQPEARLLPARGEDNSGENDDNTTVVTMTN